MTLWFEKVRGRTFLQSLLCSEGSLAVATPHRLRKISRERERESASDVPCGRFGVVRLSRTFSTYIFRGEARCAGCITTQTITCDSFHSRVSRLAHATHTCLKRPFTPLRPSRDPRRSLSEARRTVVCLLPYR